MDLQELRTDIDRIDDQMTALFVQRMEAARQIAEWKQTHETAVTDVSREREIINRQTGAVPPELAGYTKVLYQTLFDVSRSFQHSSNHAASQLCTKIDRVIESTPKERPDRAVVACQGVEGAYSQHAADKMFKYPSILYFSGFEEVFKAVDSGLCRYGVLPVENSTAGSVNEVYDLMRKYRFYITHSIKLFIGHALLAPEGVKESDIKIVYSHPQALAQCSEYIAKNRWKAHICKNTAEAAKLVAEKGRTDVAAIGAKDNAELYGLSVLSTAVQNTQNNYTRFICISKEPEIYPGANKTSIMLSLAHRPGSLYHAISRFAALDLNLTKLESRPIAGSNFEFMFYFDVEASVYSPALRTLITELEAESQLFTYLGSYTED